VLDFFRMKKIFNKHILRWTSNDVLKGYINFYGTKILLKTALKSKSRCKVDFVVLLNSIYSEFSIIYKFPFSEQQDRREQLMNDIFINYYEGNYFKMSRRIFSILPDNDLLKSDLLKMFNSNLGLIYNVIHDLNIILYILENENNIQYVDIKKELQILRHKISKLQMDKESFIFRKIDSLQSHKNKQLFINAIQEIIFILSNNLNEFTKKELYRLRLLPLPNNLSIV
jgi:hypothetical protein